MNSRIARITIGRTQINNYIDNQLELDGLDLLLDDPMTMCYVIASYWLYHSPRREMEQRFGATFNAQFPEVFLNGVPVRNAKGWFKQFSGIIGEKNTEIFIAEVYRNFMVGVKPQHDVSMEVMIPYNFPRTKLEKPNDYIIEKKYERSFKVRDILKVMDLPHSTRYICHAICLLIANGDEPLENFLERYERDIAQWEAYRQPYYHCAEWFTPISSALSCQVIEQTKAEVNESVYMFKPDPLDYYRIKGEIWLNGTEYSDFVQRRVMLKNMLEKNPEAEIHVSLQVPMDFELALAQRE